MMRVIVAHMVDTIAVSVYSSIYFTSTSTIILITEGRDHWSGWGISLILLSTRRKRRNRKR